MHPPRPIHRRHQEASVIPRLLKNWDRVRSSFWFVPALMTAGGALAALGVVALDRAKEDDGLDGIGFVYSGGAEGASDVLATVAGSMITITGVVFSMTLVALSLASQQLGPRLLRNFMRDTANQVVLGTFVATFVYCLLVLRTIRRPDEGLFVPQLAVTLGVALAIASMGVLIYFIHHISLSVQADQVVARVGHDLDNRIDELYPDPLEPEAKPESSPDAVPAFDGEAHAVAAARDGYVQSVDVGALLKLATDEDVVLRVEPGPGSYVVAGAPLVRIRPPVPVTTELAERVNAAFIFGTSRTPWQDLEFTVQQLVEIAVRALSPGVNDPFTAIRCVDQLGSALARIIRREIPSPYIHDPQDHLRVIRPVASFPEISDAALNQLRQHARSSAAVTIRLLETIAAVGAFAKRAEDREALRRHADMVARGATEHLGERADRADADERYRLARKVLDSVEVDH